MLALIAHLYLEFDIDHNGAHNFYAIPLVSVLGFEFVSAISIAEFQ